MKVETTYGVWRLFLLRAFNGSTDWYVEDDEVEIDGRPLSDWSAMPEITRESVRLPVVVRGGCIVPMEAPRMPKHYDLCKELEAFIERRTTKVVRVRVPIKGGEEMLRAVLSGLPDLKIEDEPSAILNTD